MDTLFFFELEMLIYTKTLLIRNGKLWGNIYKLELHSFLSVSTYVNIVSSTKRLRLNEKSSTLWHICLDHISRQRME